MHSIPDISVVMITYNHEKFIERAIEGVLMQRCHYSVELIIANDNSPDKTHDIVSSFIKKNHQNPKIIIRYTKHSSNKGMMHNFIWALKKAKGKYIALCDGDDYWTDPLKLQKQVDFLETKPEYVLCYHDYRNQYLFDGGLIKNGPIKERKPMTFTLLYRNVLNKIPIEIFESANPDTFIRALLCDHGKFYYMDNIAPGIRGVHDNGAVSNLDELDLWPRRIKTHEALLKYYKGHQKEAFYREKVARFKIKYNSLLLKDTSLPKKIEIYKDSFFEALKGHCIPYFIKRMILQKD